MNVNYTYLKELDSVYTSKHQQEVAEMALLNALLFENKIVVLSYNQIADSIAFLHCLQDEEQAEYIYSFFKSKRIILNKYERNCNLSKYIQDNLNNESFHSSYFSFIDDSIQNKVKKEISKAIQYNDIKFITEYENQFSPEDYLKIKQYVKSMIKINYYLYEQDNDQVYLKTDEANDRNLSQYLDDIIKILRVINAPFVDKFSYIKCITDKKSLKRQSKVKDVKYCRSDYYNTVDNDKEINEEDKLLFKELINIAYHSTIENQIGITPNLEKNVKSVINKDYNSNLEKQGFAETKFDWNCAYRIVTFISKIKKKRNTKNSILIYFIVIIVECLQLLIILFGSFIFDKILDYIPKDIFMFNIPFVAALVSFMLVDLINSFVDRKIIPQLPEWVGDSWLKQLKNAIKDSLFMIISFSKIKRYYGN